MFNSASLLSALSLLVAVRAQQIGTNTAETHPAMTWQSCTASGCTTNSGGQVVLDSNWRWVHDTTGYTNCYTGNTWNATICPDPVTCAQNCALDGADYSGTYGITTSGDSLKLNFVTTGSNTNVGSRVYLMASNTEYEMFNLNNREFTFDVDVSNLPCGLNGALYFSEMAADGGLSKYPNNKAGAQYGTGYCDSQCPRDIKFIDGAANLLNWTPSTNDTNAGTGQYGTCCTEMDIWEANSISAAYTAHPCTVTGQTQCNGTDCGAASTDREGGFCDPDGCDFNSYRLGDTTFYGPGMTVDTTKVFTVVTQFITADGTDTGALSQINRFYVQNNVTIPNSFVNIAGIPATDNSITTAFCDAKITAFGDSDSFTTKGGIAEMGQSFARGHVLVMSIWDDHAVDMLWLDSTYPTNSTSPGAARGTCSITSGNPSTIETTNASASVTYSNIKFGTLNSTFKNPGSTAAPPPPGGGQTTSPSTGPTSTPPHTTTPTTTAPASGPTQTHYGQCGGIGWTGPTACASGTTCKVSNPYYSQCL